MNAKLQALFLALVLVVMMVGEGESFLGNGQNVGKKRAILKEVEGPAKDTVLPFAARTLRLARKDEKMHIRGEELCELAKRNC